MTIGTVVLEGLDVRVLRAHQLPREDGSRLVAGDGVQDQHDAALGAAGGAAAIAVLGKRVPVDRGVQGYQAQSVGDHFVVYVRGVVKYDDVVYGEDGDLGQGQTPDGVDERPFVAFEKKPDMLRVFLYELDGLWQTPTPALGPSSPSSAGLPCGVVRDGRDVFDAADLEAGASDGPDGGLGAGAGCPRDRCLLPP